MKNHASEFRKTIWPSFIDDAISIQDAAKQAADRGHNSYFQAIMESYQKKVAKLRKPQSRRHQNIVNDAQISMKTIIKDQLEFTEATRLHVNRSVETLKSFQGKTDTIKKGLRQAITSLNLTYLGLDKAFDDVELRLATLEHEIKTSKKLACKIHVLSWR